MKIITSQDEYTRDFQYMFYRIAEAQLHIVLVEGQLELHIGMAIRQMTRLDMTYNPLCDIDHRIQKWYYGKIIYFYDSLYYCWFVTYENINGYLPMRSARKKFSTNKCAYVVYFDATVSSTFMSTTRSLFIASLFTQYIIRSTSQFLARQFTIHRTTTTPYL